jgi:hypothetical protein
VEAATEGAAKGIQVVHALGTGSVALGKKREYYYRGKVIIFR